MRAVHLTNKIKDYFEFNSITSSLLLAILEQEDLFNGTLENVNEQMLQEIIENKWENIDLDGVCEPVSILCCLNPDICDMIMMWKKWSNAS